MASTYLTRSLVNSEQKTFTISVWLKRTKLGTSNTIFGVGSGSYASKIYFDSDDKIDFWNYFNASYAGRKVTNRRFRDTSAWFHLVFAVDTTLANASERMRIYVNGVEETSFSTSSNPNQNQTFEFNSSSSHEIGRQNTQPFEGCMSHFHFIDGTQYDADTFGETDSTTGQWKINVNPSVTYGTNGFFILKDGNSVTDQSGNGNNFTVAGGTLTQTEDNPSNVFATYNANVTQTAGTSGRNASVNLSLANGNLSAGAGAAIFADQVSTLGFTKGKYYAEFQTTGDTYTAMGIVNQKFIDAYLGDYIGSEATSGVNNIGYQSVTGVVKKNDSTQYTGSTFTSANDIIGVAVDLDNNYIYFHKNGTYQNSGDPTSGATGTGGVSILEDEYFFAVSAHNNSGSGTQYVHANFGNGYFGTTAITSEGTNASGIGKFEYDVPTGYTALSTKGLNE